MDAGSAPVSTHAITIDAPPSAVCPGSQVDERFGYGKNRMRFELVSPEHVLATRSADGDWVWTFVLAENGGRTRPISRNRIDFNDTPGSQIVVKR